MHQHDGHTSKLRESVRLKVSEGLCRPVSDGLYRPVVLLSCLRLRGASHMLARVVKHCLGCPISGIEQKLC